MSGPRQDIPQAVREAQAKASDPDGSAFVTANAGSGKTHVLASRVIRLLLSGVTPEKILCITFTKAAAANMAERVFTTLGHWVTLDDAALDAAIVETGAPRPSARQRRRARELFACALETPGGLKVQTIHALCTRLLQQFPFEANVPARFAVLDDRDQAQMMERANIAVLLAASAAPDSAEGRALEIAMANAADATFRDVVREACLSRQNMLAWVDRAGDPQTALAQLAQTLGIGADERLEDVEREIANGPYLPSSEWETAATLFETGSKTDADQALRLRQALAEAGSAQVDRYLGVFLTDKMEPRKSLATKKIGDARPDFTQRLERERERVFALLQKRRAIAARERTHALLVIASAVAAHYRREKQVRGVLDYDDLIDKTLAMLDNVSAGWVHFKLDRGVDHVLIDEAQDTSPRQWDIIERIIAEFAAGQGARDGVKRTVFAVGDEKQSIFSFQGAEPREFDLRKRDIGARFKAAQLAFESVSFNYSFRSGVSVLQSVSATFATPEIFRSVTTDSGGMAPHMALADAAPAMVELWDLEVADARPEIEGWRAPFDAVAETSPDVRLADRVQRAIGDLIARREMTGPAGKRRPLSYGDILILVRRRGTAFDAVIQALKHARIPVAGADRLKLTEHIAIIDLMNLADALLLPRDDLALAVALKSPLFGLDDDDLLLIAPQRKGTLREALARHAMENTKLHEALTRLERCEHRFAQETPFSFYSWLLGGDGGRARILARLGPEANDALDEFLELALSYERKEAASLQGFMAWLRSADIEIKRDMEIRRDEVRVMTAHGAKGLEAAVVFLIDTTRSPTESQRLSLVRLPQGNAAPGAPNVVVWTGRKADDPPAVADARAAMTGETDDEYRRLLYVAMTRAADRLIVGGVLPGNRKEPLPTSWYCLIRDGLERSGLHMQAVETAYGPVRRYARPEDFDQPTADAPAPQATFSEPAPSWLHSMAARERDADTVLHPSDPLDERDTTPRLPQSSEARIRARQRGTLVHRLLQSLPNLPAAQRKDAATAFLTRNARDTNGWTPPERGALATQVLELIDNPQFAAVFAPGSRAEVPIIGRLQRRHGSPLLISGQIDRLVVSDTEILIVDYKTNQAPPQSPDDTPPAYLRQMALYRAVLGRLYPDRAVRCCLLWTERPEIVELSTAALDAELRPHHLMGTNLDPATGRS
ncbi:MAG: double-strand break repair helicase AddA [Afipia sp.]|nr:double-strand break repair helicase AddA [Afipia sp.]OJW63636.1 MAG: double-strand break repair helicase AddA [Afipia sp. 64-13]